MPQFPALLRGSQGWHGPKKCKSSRRTTCHWPAAGTTHRSGAAEGAAGAAGATPGRAGGTAAPARATAQTRALAAHPSLAAGASPQVRDRPEWHGLCRHGWPRPAPELAHQQIVSSAAAPTRALAGPQPPLSGQAQPLLALGLRLKHTCSASPGCGQAHAVARRMRWQCRSPAQPCCKTGDCPCCCRLTCTAEPCPRDSRQAALCAAAAPPDQAAPCCLTGTAKDGGARHAPTAAVQQAPCSASACGGHPRVCAQVPGSALRREAAQRRGASRARAATGPRLRRLQPQPARAGGASGMRVTQPLRRLCRTLADLGILQRQEDRACLRSPGLQRAS